MELVLVGGLFLGLLVLVLGVITEKKPTKGGVKRTVSTSKPRRAQTPTPQRTTISEPLERLEGRAYIIDGDSLVIAKKELRLFGVDAPEFDHPFGKKAKWALVALCKGQLVRAEILEIDTHGRLVARCFLPDGRDLSAEMVKQGLALDWPKFSGGAYKKFELQDIRKKLWLADARQKGRMHVWAKYEANKKARSENKTPKVN